MEAAVMVVGFAAEAVAWWLVATGRRSVWAAVTPVLVAMGLAVLLVGPPAWSPRVAPLAAVGAGLGIGVVLYLATRAFVAIARPWEAFRRDTVRMYRQQGSRPLGVAALLSVALAVPGEELFWRGLFQPGLAAALEGRAALAAVASWIAFVAANLPSRNLAIAAGAVVGGAVWAALGWWTGGALASLVCHAAWTALMLALPVVRGAAEAAP